MKIVDKILYSFPSKDKCELAESCDICPIRGACIMTAIISGEVCPKDTTCENCAFVNICFITGRIKFIKNHHKKKEG